jgi:hypothetical protein
LTVSDQRTGYQEVFPGSWPLCNCGLLLSRKEQLTAQSHFARGKNFICRYTPSVNVPSANVMIYLWQFRPIFCVKMIDSIKTDRLCFQFMYLPTNYTELQLLNRCYKCLHFKVDFKNNFQNYARFSSSFAHLKIIFCTLAGFDLATHNSLVEDDATRPRRLGKLSCT